LPSLFLRQSQGFVFLRLLLSLRGAFLSLRSFLIQLPLLISSRFLLFDFLLSPSVLQSIQLSRRLSLNGLQLIPQMRFRLRTAFRTSFTRGLQFAFPAIQFVGEIDFGGISSQS